MPTFEYQAQGADGQVVSGVVFGTSLDHAAGELSRKGMQVLRIGLAMNPNDPLAAVPAASPGATPISETPRVTEGPAPSTMVAGPSTEERSYMATSVAGPLVGQVGLTHLAFFFRQLATMLEAGVPYVQSLDTLSNQARSPKLRTIIQELKGHVEAGRPISAGMQRYPEVFSPVVMSLVRVGERGGFLDRALELVADYLDQEIKLRNLYKRLTFYPKLQVAASIIIILAANLILGSLGSASRLSSPLTTPATWIWLGPLIVIVFLFLRVGLANPTVKFSWDMMISNLPYMGNTLRQLAMAKFGRAFGALYKGGVSIPESVKLSADACGNEWLRSLMYPAVAKLEEGQSIGRTLRETHAFSPIVLDMVETGERTGNLDHMLNKMADYYEDEATTRSTQTAYVMGALIGLLVAVYIGYIVISFWSGYGAQYQDQM